MEEWGGAEGGSAVKEGDGAARVARAGAGSTRRQPSHRRLELGHVNQRE